MLCVIFAMAVQVAVRTMVDGQDRRLSAMEASLAAIQAHMTSAGTAAATPASTRSAAKAAAKPANPHPQQAQNRIALAVQGILGASASDPPSAFTAAGHAGGCSTSPVGSGSAAAPRPAGLPEQRPPAGRSQAAWPSLPPRAPHAAVLGEGALAAGRGSLGNAAAPAAPGVDQAGPAGAGAAVPDQPAPLAPHAPKLSGGQVQLAGQEQRRRSATGGTRRGPSRGAKRPRGDRARSSGHNPDTGSGAAGAKRSCLSEARAPAPASGLPAAPPLAAGRAAGGMAELYQRGAAAEAQQRPDSAQQAEAQAPIAPLDAEAYAQRGAPAPPPWLTATAAARAAAASVGAATIGALGQAGSVGAAAPPPGTGHGGSQEAAAFGAAEGGGCQGIAIGSRADLALPTSAPALPPALPPASAPALAPGAGVAADAGRPCAAANGPALSAGAQGCYIALPAAPSAEAGPDARGPNPKAAGAAAQAAAGGQRSVQEGAAPAPALGREVASNVPGVGGAPAAGARRVPPGSDTAVAGAAAGEHTGGIDTSKQQPGAHAMPPNSAALPALRQHERVSEVGLCANNFVF